MKFIDSMLSISREIPGLALIRSLTATAVLAGAISLAPDAYSVTVSVGNGPGSGTSSSFVYDEGGYGTWYVADLSDPITPAPISIVPDTNAGPWTLNLTFAPGTPDLAPGDTFIVQELLTINAGSFSLNGWSQEITTPGWKWTDASIFDNSTSFPLDGLSVNLSDSIASFSFNTLPVGTQILVVKSLEYTGSAGPAAPLSVETTAVPEPGTLAFLSLVGVWVAAVKIRKLSRRISSVA